MSVYKIIEVKVTDPQPYAEYVAKVPAVIAQFGGKYLASGPAKPLSGNWKPERIIVIEFPSHEQLHKCFGSDEYRQIAPLREQSAAGKSIVVEACKQIT